MCSANLLVVSTLPGVSIRDLVLYVGEAGAGLIHLEVSKVERTKRSLAF